MTEIELEFLRLRYRLLIAERIAMKALLLATSLSGAKLEEAIEGILGSLVVEDGLIHAIGHGKDPAQAGLHAEELREVMDEVRQSFLGIANELKAMRH